MAIPPRLTEVSKRHVVRLVIVDDHAFTRDLVSRMLARQRARYAVLAAVGTAAEAIAACGALRPDLLILDINLPDQNGIDALPELKRVAPATRILLCTGHPTDDRIAHLAATGAHGFVEKTTSWEEFLQALERVSNGEYYFCSRNAGINPESGPWRKDERTLLAPYLTAREKEIIALIAEGFTSKEIGAKLYISAATVESHRANLMAKLRCRNAAELASRAARAGLTKGSRNVPLPVRPE